MKYFYNRPDNGKNDELINFKKKCKICGSLEYSLYDHIRKVHNITEREYSFQTRKDFREYYCKVCKRPDYSLFRIGSGYCNPYCEYSIILDESEVYTCCYCNSIIKSQLHTNINHCDHCNKDIPDELIICPYCKSQIKYMYGIRFCTNSECKIYSTFYDCQNVNNSELCKNCSKKVIKLFSGEANFRSKCYYSFGEKVNFDYIMSIGFLHTLLCRTFTINNKL